jgi:sugar/nucleoside kinase (ribokinase family)
MGQGLFVGLTTLDCLYLTTHFPQSNEKMVAIDQLLTVGGPATNAAITFAHFGHQSSLMSVVGNHSLTTMIHQTLKDYGVKGLDLAPTFSASPAVSSIIITQGTGERAVVSINATKLQANLDDLNFNLIDLLEQIDLVLIDGHQMLISAAIAKQAQKQNIPVVLDGGSWKPGLETVLPYIDYGICSANFYPPTCQNTDQVCNYLQNYKIPHFASTQGAKPIIYHSLGQLGEIPVPTIKAVDTLGAGDIFHGAFCHYLLENNLDEHSFPDSLSQAARIAQLSCQYFGPHQWMKDQ